MNQSSHVVGGSKSDALRKYMSLDIAGNIQVLYIWIDGIGEAICSKTKTVYEEPKEYGDLPAWHFDGSSAKFTEEGSGEIYLQPVALFNDPFRGKPHKMVLCETHLHDGQPGSTNLRQSCLEVMEKEAVENAGPLFAVEQQYTLLDKDRKPRESNVGAGGKVGREIMEAHYRACLYAGVKLSGANAEPVPSQWEFQVGPCKGIEMGDQLWMARYILERVAEDFDAVVSFVPKPIPGDWKGAGCHITYSTKAMREKNGMAVVMDAVDKLREEHEWHILQYFPTGDIENPNRLSAASIEPFSSGIASIRSSVGIHVPEDGKGCLVDRRPASNSDPYAVTAAIVKTTLLEESGHREIYRGSKRLSIANGQILLSNAIEILHDGMY